MTGIEYKNLDRSESFERLRKLSSYDIRTLTADRIRELQVPMARGLTFNYAASPVTSEVLAEFSSLASEQQLIEKYRAIYEGEAMNTGEKRMVLHHLLRGQLGRDVHSGDTNQRAFYLEQQQRFQSFASGVRSGQITAPNGKPFTTVVQIGIGGSDLGPRALYLALEPYMTDGYPDGASAGARGGGSAGAGAPGGKDPGARIIPARFISNVDPDDAANVLKDVDIETALFVLVSKSGTTQETLTNEQLVADLAAQKIGKTIDIAAQTVAVTSQTSPLAKSDRYLDAFFIDDFIGGRYSATSAVGGVILSIAFGPEIFEEILQGAHEADRSATEPDVGHNAALLDALIGVYYRNVLNYSATAVLPYSQGLHRFPAHLQQLDMESNGKRVNRDGAPVDYQTGPIVFGEPGTNGQHSFYQLLHQGTTIVPLQFIGFKASQRGQDTTFEGSSSQVKLNANLAAQIVAFATGQDHQNPNKSFPGGRPSTLIYGQQLTPGAVGALLAHYENKVMFQGLIWNLNSFDQEGVQLGKVLTKEVLGGKASDVLNGYAELLGIRSTGS